MNNENKDLNNSDFVIADLTNDAKSKIENLEEELEITLVAYDCKKWVLDNKVKRLLLVSQSFYFDVSIYLFFIK